MANSKLSKVLRKSDLLVMPIGSSNVSMAVSTSLQNGEAWMIHGVQVITKGLTTLDVAGRLEFSMSSESIGTPVGYQSSATIWHRRNAWQMIGGSTENYFADVSMPMHLPEPGQTSMGPILYAKEYLYFQAYRGGGYSSVQDALEFDFRILYEVVTVSDTDRLTLLLTGWNYAL